MAGRPPRRRQSGPDALPHTIGEWMDDIVDDASLLPAEADRLRASATRDTELTELPVASVLRWRDAGLSYATSGLE
jgi:hypothetical protein